MNAYRLHERLATSHNEPSCPSVLWRCWLSDRNGIYPGKYLTPAIHKGFCLMDWWVAWCYVEWSSEERPFSQKEQANPPVLEWSVEKWLFKRKLKVVICDEFSLSFLMVSFPGEPGLAGFIEAKDDGSGGDYWSYKTCKAPVKSSPPTKQHPMFYRLDALPVAQPSMSKHWTEKWW